ncbi:MAG: hypothetical protein K8S55_15740 [Phycisphaerae bacterium]|nr:hypothetical protein [Phycisphaerae bacterium]
MKWIKREQVREDLENILVVARQPVERFLCEVEFAEELNRLQGPSSGRWLKLISQARAIVDKMVASGKVNHLKKAVRQAEEVLSPIGKAAKKYTVHCVGHAHIDMNWMWSWPETVAVTNDTFTTVLKLMEEFPDFCFSQSQASVYEIIREHNPELFEKIKQRVAEGRWEITAAQWVEGDKNLVSGESLTRHLLYTRRYMKEHFGLEPEDVPLDWEPDTFGHAHTIPTIISRGAVTRYYMCRGGADDKPPVFWWQGPDGSRILVNIEHTWYNDHISPHNVKGLLSFCEKTGLKDWMLVYGVGDHGGGPTRRDLKLCREMNSWPIFPNFCFDTTKKYYEILEAQADKLPVLDQELNFEFTGCYSSQSLIKKTNRLGENFTEQAETAATLAWRVLGKSYPGDKLRQAWVDTIFGHFHDILPGSGVAATREYHSGLFQKTAATTGIITTQSLRALAAAVDTSFAADEPPDVHPILQNISMGAGVGRGAYLGVVSSVGHSDNPARGFVVFNPTAWDRDEVVRFSVWDSETDDVQTKRFIVCMPDGREIPAQRVTQGDYWGHRYIDLSVPVSVAAMGYTTFAVKEAGPIPQPTSFGYDVHFEEKIEGGVSNLLVPRPHSESYVGDWAMENEFLTVEFDRQTGGIIKLVDKATGRNLVSPDNPAGLLEYILEKPGEMSSWVLHDPKKRVCPLEVVSFKPAMSGPHAASFEAKLKLNDSTFSVEYILNAGQSQLEIAIKANWLERGGPEIGTPSLRMQFPLALADAKGRYEIPYGSIERKLNSGEEVPALRWADITGKLNDTNSTAGCALLNDCKYGYSLDGSTLRVTLLRSSYEPDPLPELGEHEIRLAMVPHGKTMKTAELVQLGADFNHPLISMGTDIHKGDLPAVSGGVITCKPSNVLITAVKKAEDEDAVIVRLLETAGKNTTANVTLNTKLMGTAVDAVEVDLIERPQKNSTAAVTKNGFRVKLPANGIASVKINFKK